MIQRITSIGVALLLLLTTVPGCTARNKADWSKIQAVAPDTKTEVQLYEGVVPHEEQKIKGRFVSATPDSVTLQLKDGRARTVQKDDIRKILTRRPFLERWPGWVAFGVTFGVLQSILSASARVDNVSGSTMAQAHAYYTLPITTAFFIGSRMKGVYEKPKDWYPQENGKGKAR